ncbi:pentalenolactone synthase [Tamaricihabitans halophyticus]|uniref:Pentalenolactone synthase n=1 Tax=Tamaricihabitans halophyticus TaxID=1262583 RepID=A0A4R2QVZ5_9PSEU|nr:cytochrome P450 [Tamaricihabitans halophyticus]TCP54272.1 pentalenolactone synthase [Tamaricihabitans halophyticus]
MSEQLPELPVGQSSVLAHDPRLLALRDGGCPISRVRIGATDEAWVATRHAEVRAIYANSELGRTHHDPDTAARVNAHPVLGGPSELYSHADEETEHKEMRRLLGGYFSARRLRDLQPYITDVAAELLDAMAQRAHPVDLHEAFSYPLALRVLCELLGVPYTDRDLFERMVVRMDNLDDDDEVNAGHQELFGYLCRIVPGIRKTPEGSSVLAGLCAQGLDDETIAGFASLLLFAGHASTAFHIDAGAVLLATHAAEFRRLAEEPTLVDGAVEEVLRTAERGAMGFLRYARTSTELSDVIIERGEAIVPQLSLANFDEQVFADPARFDIGRRPNPHLSFGHGPWHCLGAPLARAVLRTAFRGLTERFPGLELAVPFEELRQGDSGFVALPVRW